MAKDRKPPASALEAVAVGAKRSVHAASWATKQARDDAGGFPGMAIDAPTPASARGPVRVWALVVSSCFFLAPVAVLWFHLDHSYVAAMAILAGATGLISVATWWDRSNCKIADADRAMARVSGLIHTFLGLAVIPTEVLVTTGFPLWFAVLGLYAASVYWNREVFHFGFHVAVAAGMTLIARHLVEFTGTAP